MYKKLLIIVLLFFPLNISGLDQRSILMERIITLQKEVARLEKTIVQMQIKSPSYVVIDIENNSTIIEKNPNKIYPIASITKLISSLIALEEINLEEKIILTEEMLRPIGHSPSLFLGLNVSAENLLKASIIQSTNDASNSLSHFMKEGEFLSLMRKKAKEIGMENTYLYDPHGLNPLNRSTPTDIYKLIYYILENHPSIFEISKDNNFFMPNIEGRMLKFKNVNNFYNHPFFVGGKTGYLPQAKQTFASIFEIKGRKVAIVILYSENRIEDTLNIINWLERSGL